MKMRLGVVILFATLVAWMGAASAAETTVTMNSDKTVTAVFVKQWTLTMAATPSDGGTTDPAVGDHVCDEGDVVNLAATPNPGYAFDHWEGNVADPNVADTTIALNADETVTAVFVKQWTLTMAASPSDGGTTTPAVGANTHDDGETVNLTATANPGYTFDHWEGDVADPNAAETTITMNADETVTAVFALDTAYTLTVESSPSPGVSITGTHPGDTPYTASVPGGTSVTLTAPETDGALDFSRWADSAGELLSTSRTLAFSMVAEQASSSPLYAGTAKVDITPPEEDAVDLTNNPMEIHDTIYARVLVLKNDDVSLAIVSLDLILFSSAKVVADAKAQWGVDHVILSSTHTHSSMAPQGLIIGGGQPDWTRMGDPEELIDWPALSDDPWYAETEDKIVAAIGVAMGNLFPARIGSAQSPFESYYVTHNRRLVNPDGSVTMLWANPGRIPTEPLDPTIRVIRVDDAAGAPRAVLVHYACHPVVLMNAGMLSRDFPGAMADHIEQELGEDCMGMFLQGAEGDIDTYEISLTGEYGLDYVQQGGADLGQAAVSLAESIATPAPTEAAIRIKETMVPIAHRDGGGSTEACVMSVVINEETAMVTIPGEPFVQHQLNLAAHSPIPNSMVLGLAYCGSGNPFLIYVPTAQAVAEGGYGATECSFVEPDAGANMVNAGLAFLTAFVGDTTVVAEYADMTMPDTLYVNDDAVGEPGAVCTVAGDDANDGFTPDTPMRNIQALLSKYPDIGTGTTVWVDPGTYVENVLIDTDHSGLTIQGAGQDTTILDGNQSGSCLVLSGFVDGVISGLTISNGSATNGGGIYSSASSPTITHCTFSGNTVDWYGAGMYNTDSSPTLTDCTFTGNTDADLGGGMYSGGGSSVTVTRCVFDGNEGRTGAGMMNHNVTATVRDCLFIGNTGSTSSGGGGGMHNNNSTTEVINCVFIDNSTGWGGGIYIEICPTTTITNCTFSGNSASNDGGGISCDGASPTLTNCILWGNTAGVNGAQIGVPAGWSSGVNTITVRYSDVQGGETAVVVNPADTLTWGAGNLDADPLFVDAATDDYHLQPASPCIDAADGPAAPTADMIGHPRQDDPDTPNVGIGPPWADMGAYEFQVTIVEWTLTMDVSPSEGGTTDPAVGDHVYANGTVVGLTATENPGYAFDHWEGNVANPNAAATTITMNADETVTAVFVRQWTLTMAATPVGGGTTAPAAGDHVYDDGTVVDLTATANGGYTFDHWEGNVADPNVAETTITMNADETVTAVFTPDMLYVNDDSFAEPDSACTAIGDDANDGFSPEAPMRNIQALLNKYPNTGTGKTVWVDPGTYVENVSIGASHAGLTLQGAGPDATIVDGNQASSCLSLGQGADVAVSGFTFSNGRAYSGAGMNIGTCTAVVTDCSFTDNSATVLGGGIYCHTDSSSTITHCTFSGNSAEWGAGILNYHCEATVADCTFSGNTADLATGGGGGMVNHYSSITVTNCIFSENVAGSGGGICNEGTPTIMTNCTFVGNSADYDGGGICNDDASPTVTNCILWANTSPSGPQIGYYALGPTGPNTLTVRYSDVQGGEASVTADPADTINWGPGNIDEDPLFLNAATADYHLQPGSPCIDSADGPAAPTVDMEGNPRHDDPGIPNVGIAPPWADMGAYEFQGTTSWTLVVQSTPVTGVAISSSTGHGSTTDYAVTEVVNDTSVDLQAPAMDPTGYTFLRWTLDGAAQPNGQKSITFTMDDDKTAVAEYVQISTYTLTVEVSPAEGGATAPAIGAHVYDDGTVVNLTATANTGYRFDHWEGDVADPNAAETTITMNANETVTAIFEPEIVVTHRFDFGTASSPVAADYTRVTEGTTYTAPLGHGWIAGTPASRDRGAADALTRDFCFSEDATFAVDLAAGSYDVTVTLGDASYGHDRMGVFLEGTQVDDVTTVKGVFATATYSTDVTDGQLTLRLQDMGGSDANVTINALEIVSTGPPPATLTVEIADDSIAENAGAAATTGRVTRSGETTDPLVVALSSDDTSEATVPASVTIQSGDPYADFDIDAVDDAVFDGDQTVTVTANASGYLDGNDTVVVTDDEVPVEPEGRYDFGTASSPVESGYLRVSHTTVYSVGQGYGWLSGTVDSRDRAIGTALTRDLCFSGDATFIADVANGTYDVTVTLGDASHAHDRMGVFLEGAQVDEVTTGAGVFAANTYAVNVTDGQLTVRLQDMGGADVNVTINALEVVATGPPPAALSVEIAAETIAENAGASATTGRVTRTGDTTDALVVTLSSDDTSEATVPASVTILSGDTYADFDIDAVDDAEADDDQTVTIAATAAGYLDGADTVVVTDDEVPVEPEGRYDFGTATSPVETGYSRVSHGTVYSAAQGYGWLLGDVDSRDRSIGTALTRDLCFSGDATFVADVVPGDYEATVTLGDATNDHDLMGVFLEAVQVDTVTTGANVFATATYAVHVADGQLTLRLADLGGSDANVTINALEIVSTGPAPDALTVTITPGSIVENAGPSAATGRVTRNGDTTDALEVTFSSNDTSEATVPVSVTILAGESDVDFDIDAVDDTETDGDQIVTITATAAGYLDGADTVVVTDDEAPPEPVGRYDFGTATSPVESDYTRVTHTTTYSGAVGYGWTAGTVDSRDRGTGTALTRDFCFSGDATFEADLAAGTYEVAVTLGDMGYGHDRMGVSLEGTPVDDVTTAKGETATGVYTVAVTDGTLTVRLHDLGGDDVNVAVNAIEIIDVTAPENQAPEVDAGPNGTVTLPESATLDGTVSDDGLPNPPGTCTVTWTKQSGPGTVTFGDWWR